MSISGAEPGEFRILAAEMLAPEVKRFEVVAPRIARKRHAGQFVIVRLYEHGERIPLTIVDADPDRGTITLIVQGVGKTTKRMNRMEEGGAILDVVGPLGRPTEVGFRGNVVVIGGGVGVAIAYPVAVAFQEAGNHVTTIVGARSAEQVILVEELERTSDDLLVTTEDGSGGRKGLVTDALEGLITAGRSVDLVHAVGPIAMMRAVAEVTRPHGIPTVVSLNPIMVDGTGMCGGCRVLIGGETRFACVDGPEFDAHLVDFETLARRNTIYRRAERVALDDFLADSTSDPERPSARPEEPCKLEEAHPEVAGKIPPTP